ncbi:hypothetical protein B0A55_07946 [Friedmanniomyces simplex]|uniref:non-specific serine/threonine protein kinase n=1 Tax=Friedmanniomyces simplex TaxID=329884 RepID=A0A4U0WR05_9PEZI|nr:hypothetical protein B0A55_07946 [Friedmanniomyces simplex]
MTTPPRFELIDPDVLVEEETLPEYRPERYYPVTINQLFKNRYRVVVKLGYGSASTVWLCRDLHSAQDAPSHVALKVYVSSLKVHRELPVYQHLDSLESKHMGRRNVRKIFEAFEIPGPHGKHMCLVHEACGVSLFELTNLTPGKVMDVGVLRQIMRPVLNGLQYLHEEAKIVHTDLQPNNVLMGINDPSIFDSFEQDEVECPAPRKEIHGRTIYMSRRMQITSGFPKISDLSEARFIDAIVDSDLVMPDVHRAPENILGMSWGPAIDIWALAMMLWDLLERYRFLSPYDEEGDYCDQHHLAQLIAILGPPPLDFLERSEYSWKYFNRDGTWKGDVPIPPDMSLEAAEKRLEGPEKRQFLALMRKILKWRPEDRPSIKEIFFDEWLCADLIESGVVQQRDGECVVLAPAFTV